MLWKNMFWFASGMNLPIKILLVEVLGVFFKEGATATLFGVANCYKV
jgi:hypothetical protein